MKKISVVLFDLGNVLVHVDLDAFWKELGLHEPAQRKQYENAYRAAYLDFEMGAITTDSFLDQLEQGAKGNFTREQLRKAFLSIIRQPVEGMESIVKRVGNLCQTALVSNTNELHYNYSLETVPALKLLHEHFLSFRLKVMKPSHRYYEEIIRAFNIPSEAALFIDDVQENVEGTLAAGMRAHLFTTPSELEHTLEVMHVLQ